MKPLTASVDKTGRLLCSVQQPDGNDSLNYQEDTKYYKEIHPFKARIFYIQINGGIHNHKCRSHFEARQKHHGAANTINICALNEHQQRNYYYRKDKERSVQNSNGIKECTRVNIKKIIE